jgi:DNA-binding response OmpR family regulator
MPKIFVIDDDPDLLKVLKTLLTKRSFDVFTFTDWEGAQEVLFSEEPQLIVLDVFLQGIDGLDISRRLKKSPQTQHIPILLFSAFPHIAENAIRDYGVDDFIVKPFDVEDLIKKIHSILSKKGGPG